MNQQPSKEAFMLLIQLMKKTTWPIILKKEMENQRKGA